jgi:hypothetical protein
MLTTKPQRCERIRWGRDKSGVWHMLPYVHISMFDSNEMILFECDQFDAHIMASPDSPPPKATVCPKCRGFLTHITLTEDL